MLPLAAGAWRLSLLPALGGSMLGLWRDGTPILREPPAETPDSVRLTGCFPLVPYTNRIGHAAFSWAGRRYTLRRNFGDEPNSIHGPGWQRPWQVIASDATSALLALEHEPDEDWPFAFAARQHFQLDEDGLTIALSMTNRAARPAPAGIGLHPFFPRHSETRIRFRSTAIWLNDPDQLPIERVARDYSAGCNAAETELDNDVEGWDGVAEIHQPGGLTIRLTAPFRWLRVFTPASRNIVALEPVSHGANALNRADPAALGVVTLPPGGTLSGTIRVSVIS